jgi:hypothetical protein
MRSRLAPATMATMIRTDPSSKLLLIADRRAAATDSVIAVRRFRLARLRLEGRPAVAPGRPRLPGRP